MKRHCDHRLEYNRKLLAIIGEYAEKWPTMRFGQLLVNLCIVSEAVPSNQIFFIESKTTLNAAKKAVRYYKKTLK